jgi:hypothetical protein
MKTVTDRQVLDSLIQRLTALTPETPRRWGTMTAAEMLGHLGDAAASVLAHPGGGPAPARPFRKWLALYAPIPWPHDLKTPNHVDPRGGGTRPGNFAADLARAVAGLGTVAAAGPAELPAAHGYFGRMSPGDWGRWGYRHTDHHLRQFGL